MDAVASLYERNSLLDIVERTSREIFIPLTVGGGLRSVEDIRAVLRAGADKVSLNTAAIRRSELIREASRAFGSSTILVSIEAIRKQDGTYEAYVDYGRQKTGVNAVEWAKEAVALGAGELVVTSIDKEGTGEGFDLDLIRQIAESVPVPVIASGGAGELRHIHDVVVRGKADAVSVASILHYHYVRHGDQEDADFAQEGNVEFLKGRRGAKGFSKIQDRTLPEIKTYLIGRGIPCRDVDGSQGTPRNR
jgi:cyclase